MLIGLVQPIKSAFLVSQDRVGSSQVARQESLLGCLKVLQFPGPLLYRSPVARNRIGTLHVGRRFRESKQGITLGLFLDSFFVHLLLGVVIEEVTVKPAVIRVFLEHDAEYGNRSAIIACQIKR